MRRILFCRNTKASWALNDLKILSVRHKVTDFFLHNRNFNFFNEIKFVFKSEIVFLWFGSMRFFPLFLFALLLKRKIIIVAGGFDVVNLPEINYGGLRGGLTTRLRKLMFNKATRIISVSKSNQMELQVNGGIHMSKSKLIYHGFEDPNLTLTEWSKRPKRVATVGAIKTETLTRKGLLDFAYLSTMMPDWDFFLIGSADAAAMQCIEKIVGANFKITGFLSQQDFDEILMSSRFYLQLSAHEGFGCSIVDAAIRGCWPIVYDKFAMPEVVEGCGSVVDNSLEMVAEEIREKWTNGNISADKLNKHYLGKFPMELRRQELLSLIDGL